MATKDSSAAPTVAPPLLVPRYVRNLCAIAERHGMATSVRVDRHDDTQQFDYNISEWVDVPGDYYLAAEWTGTKKQLFNLGLLTPSKLRPFRRGEPDCRRALRIPDCGSMPVLWGSIKSSSDNVTVTLDFGEVPREIRCADDIEVLRYADAFAYHGAPDALLAIKACEQAHLPGKHGSKRGGARLDEDESAAWYCRRHPDGLLLFLKETTDAVKRRVDGYHRRQAEAAGRKAGQIAEARRELAGVLQAMRRDEPDEATIEAGFASVDVKPILARFQRSGKSP